MIGNLSKSKRPKVRIKDRIIAALRPGPMRYRDLLAAVFPYEEWPRAWRYQSNGGPPGCAMVFGKAIRELQSDGMVIDSNPRTYHLSPKARLAQPAK